MMVTERSATNVSAHPSVKKTLFSVKQRSFRTYVVDALGAVENCYIGQVIKYGHVDHMGKTIDRLETYKLVKRD